MKPLHSLIIQLIKDLGKKTPVEIARITGLKESKIRNAINSMTFIYPNLYETDRGEIDFIFNQ